MTIEKCKDGSFVRNCLINRRKEDASPHMFYQDSEASYISAFLNGYAIIPLEEYAELTGDDYSDMIASAMEDNKELDG
jgi:hypothetical protein